MKQVINAVHHKFNQNPLLAEFFAITVGFLLAVTFSLANKDVSLPVNYEFTYPLAQVSKQECKHLHRDQLDDDCKIWLPPISSTNYDQYKDNVLYRQVYSVLWWWTYNDGWDTDHGGHLWVDFPSSRGTPVLSIGHWQVVDAQNVLGYGNMISIEYALPNGTSIYAIYAHLDSFLVNKGDVVVKWQQIGTVWDSWFAAGTHLHFEIDTLGQYGRQVYPYLGCEDSDIVAQVNAWTCRYLMFERSVDPLAFLEDYHSSAPKLASSDTSSTDLLDSDTVSDTPDENRDTDTSDTELIEPVFPEVIPGNGDNTIDTSTLYHIINNYIPRLDMSLLTPTAQRFLQEYKIQVVHQLNTVIKEWSDTTISIHISSRSGNVPFSGRLPVGLRIYANNTNLAVSPADVSYVENGKASFRVLGKSTWASVVVITIDQDQIFYSFPVVIK